MDNEVFRVLLCVNSGHYRGVDNFLGLGGLKVKTKELQFGSRWRVWEGDMPPPA